MSEFHNHIAPGDHVTRKYPGGWSITATIVPDDDSSPDDLMGYSDLDRIAWHANQWYFTGLVLSISKCGVLLDTHAASLWCIATYYRQSDDAAHFNEIFDDLEGEALGRGFKLLRLLTEDCPE
jgi:hypothetical protein